MSDFEQGSGNFDPTSTTLVFVNRRDEITGDDDPTVLRVQMSCGHAVDPKSLTAWCRSLMDQNHFTFHCPAAKENNTQKCNKIWSYLEVRRHALLDDEEQQYFEERVSTLAAAKYCEYKWFYGPRIGALYARGPGTSSPVYPMFFGGGQEKKFRPGTENTPMIAGLGKAAELVVRELEVYASHMQEVRDYLEEKLLAAFGKNRTSFQQPL
ncbi:uncharacterized protein LOC119976365 isoform X2 [Scyliorhinus canicula]|uniref:uncharacterized protein LOC119976365 isoform X2 n=1 Tax=Scyliorhinus canicula TaxID=7830 RepID=UPI0018F37EC2|nr:uncharacterized protein LOC119976365 isoform X2 [Scyliorhinus canicula]XP_038672781.1 uncharacterized protein LOC119976365 isoform X2 [Scyliorhinus canicula]